MRPTKRSTTLITGESHYWLRTKPKRNRRVFDALYDYWTAHGYLVLNDTRDAPRAPNLWVRNPEDGFSLSLDENLAADLKLAGSSACVWPTGTPPADTDTDD